MFDEVQHTKFGAVIDPVKHAFTGEDPRGGDTVEARDEFVSVPSFNAVGVTKPVEPDVGGNHGRRNPSAPLSRTCRGGAGGDDGLECLIDTEPKRGVNAAGFPQIPRHMQSIELQDGALRWANPWNRAEWTGVRPGKDAVAISRNQPLGRKVVVQCHQPEFIGGIGRRPFGGRHRAQEGRGTFGRDSKVDSEFESAVAASGDEQVGRFGQTVACHRTREEDRLSLRGPKRGAFARRCVMTSACIPALVRVGATGPRGVYATACAVMLFLWFPRVALAHDPGISTAQGELRADALTLTTGFAPADAQHFLPEASRPLETTWTVREFDTVQEQLLAVAPQLWEVRSTGGPLTPTQVRVELLPGDNVSFYVVFRRPETGDKIMLRAQKLTELPGGHRQFVVITDEAGSTITKKLLKAEDATLEVPLAGGGAKTAPVDGAGGQAESNTAWEFIKLGVEHIWTGYDHLLFLFALLLVCRSFASIIAIISCFTVAHSLTLAVATLELVHLPGRFVEAAIAGSIVYVGVENLLRRGEEPKGRWALTFVFGLIHGFGFASVLRDLGVGASGDGIVMPLLTFNLGVEAGQIAIAAVVLPVVWQLRKRDWFVRRGVPVLSALVVLAGLYWLVERTLLG